MSDATSPSRYPTRRVSLAVAVLTLAVALGAVVVPMRMWSNLFVAAYFSLTISLGGAVLVALGYVSGAGWLVAFRRIPEALAASIPMTGAILLLVLATRMRDYGWTFAGHGDPGTFWFKALWLSPGFWMLRAVLYVGLWSALAARLIAGSRQQDDSGEGAISARCIRRAALFLALFAVSFSLASVDWVMALEPLWFSTMWGVYHFAGMFQATLAAIVVLALLLRRRGQPLYGVFRDEHLHDLGRLLLGFSCFWMYIWFCQYMLIWYANIPEETSYFVTRTHGPWGAIVLAVVGLNWVVPFFLLLPRRAKRSPSLMMKVACVVLIGRWLDLYVMVFPATIGGTPVFGVWETVVIVALLAGAPRVFWRSFSHAQPVPRRDPYLAESMTYHA